MKKFLIALTVAVTVIAGTVAVTHYAADAAKVTAEPQGG